MNSQIRISGILGFGATQRSSQGSQEEDKAKLITITHQNKLVSQKRRDTQLGCQEDIHGLTKSVKNRQNFIFTWRKWWLEKDASVRNDTAYDGLRMYYFLPPVVNSGHPAVSFPKRLDATCESLENLNHDTQLLFRVTQ